MCLEHRNRRERDRSGDNPIRIEEDRGADHRHHCHQRRTPTSEIRRIARRETAAVDVDVPDHPDIVPIDDAVRIILLEITAWRQRRDDETPRSHDIRLRYPIRIAPRSRPGSDPVIGSLDRPIRVRRADGDDERIVSRSIVH